MSKYEEALERARKHYKETPNKVYKAMLEQIFPDIEENEDKKIKEEIINYFRCQSKDEPTRKEINNRWIAWLEKQGEQKPQRMISAEAKEAMYGKPAYAWSEEDEKVITGIINDIQKRLEDYPLEQLAEIYFKEIKWLKSIKERYTWKPSDEQMKQLGWIAEQDKDNMIGKELISLYQDLKKLREG